MTLRKMTHVVIGGTGTLGRAVISRLSKDPENRIICFSRDELKQKQLVAEFPDVECVLGDIRDKDAVRSIFSRACDVAWLVAALKHVDSLEMNPLEAVKTNIDGVNNVARCALMRHVPNVIFSSTDKAVLPVNVYGMTKAIGERILLNFNEQLGRSATKFTVFRWGNVIGSRGSFIHIIVDHIRRNEAIPITHISMTRFLIDIDEAVEFMMTNYDKPPFDRPKIPAMKACSMIDLVHAVQEIMGSKVPIKMVGLRPGEKIHECIESNHDFCVRSDTAEQFTHKELVDKVRPIVESLCVRS